MSKYQEYYKLQEKKDIEMYAYDCPDIGKWKIDDVEFDCGEDFRTVERYKEYKDAGFTILFSAFTAKYIGQEWETSELKMVMDRAYEAGLKKVIILDDRIMEKSRIAGGIIGEGKPFATEEDLENFIRDCFKDYTKHPAFYGLKLQDEPRHQYFKAIGQIFKAVRKVRPETFLQCNLVPILCLHCTNGMYPEGGDMYDRYKAYLCEFLDESQADYVLCDSYPFQEPEQMLFGVFSGIGRHFIRTLQICAEVCKERNVNFYFVAQSTGIHNKGQVSLRVPTKEEVYWQANLLLGFGLRELAYFTYWTRTQSYTKGEFFKDGCAMISLRGEQTPLYHAIKEVNTMIHALAPVITQFKYVADRYLISTPFRSHPFFLEYTLRKELKTLEFAETDREVAMVNELYDEKRDQWMYMIMNATDPLYNEYMIMPQKTTIRFKKKYQKVDIFEEGKWRTETLENNTFTVKLNAGHAYFILPYNE